MAKLAWTERGFTDCLVYETRNSKVVQNIQTPAAIGPIGGQRPAKLELANAPAAGQARRVFKTRKDLQSFLEQLRVQSAPSAGFREPTSCFDPSIFEPPRSLKTQPIPNKLLNTKPWLVAKTEDLWPVTKGKQRGVRLPQGCSATQPEFSMHFGYFLQQRRGWRCWISWTARVQLCCVVAGG